MKTLWILVTVIGVAALGSGIGVLIWWLVTRGDDLTTVVLRSDRLDGNYTAAFARIRGRGDVFWWFYPCEGIDSTVRPIILWLDGPTGLPPSLLANFGMIGPLDLNLNKRNGSWVEEFNLLFVDAPLGTGFSHAESGASLARNFEDTTDDLLYALESFHSTLQDYQDAPLYIFAQGDGAALALHLVHRIHEAELPFPLKLRGIALGNPIVSPALTINKLGFYLDEMGYVDPTGRLLIEEYASELNSLVDTEQMEIALDKFLALEEFINEEVGTAAVNLGYIVQKLMRGSASGTSGYFGLSEYLRSALQLPIDFNQFMDSTIAPALGITGRNYNSRQEAALEELKGFYMEPTTHLVEYILENTNISVTIYNGNFDAVSNTPGQLDWVNNLQWSGQIEFKNSTRQTLVVNGLIEGYFREADRLTFYWMNAAGVSVPLDSPIAMRRVAQRITS